MKKAIICAILLVTLTLFLFIRFAFDSKKETVVVDPDTPDISAEVEPLEPEEPIIPEEPVIEEDDDENTKYIAFVFHNGPSTATSGTLDFMLEENISATFFVASDRISTYSSEITRMGLEGHEVGNNTLVSTGMSTSEMQTAFNATNTAISNLTGTTPVLARDNFSKALLNTAGFTFVAWSIDPSDWSEKDPQTIADHIFENASDGDIVLLHDIYSHSSEAFQLVVPMLQAEGFKIVTVSELFAKKGTDLSSSKIYYSAN